MADRSYQMTEQFDPSIPTGDPEAMISWAKKRLDEAHGIPNREAYMNLAFMLGQQHVQWDSVRRRLNQPKNRPGEPNAPVRITVNKVGSLVERTISRLTKDAPMPEARPVTDQEDDIGKAKICSRILQHELLRLHWETLLPRLYFWVLPLGWSFLHPCWDADAGDAVDDLGMTDAMGKPLVDEDETLHQGQITMEIVQALELKVDPGARIWDEAKWCIRSSAMSRADIYEKYGATDVDGEPATVHNLADDLYALTDGTIWDSERRTEKSKSNKLSVHQIWMKPGGRAYPKGFVLTWCGSTTLEWMESFPYDHGQLPFVPFSLLPGVGFPEGRTWVSDLRGMQSDYNDARSREATIRRTLVPKLLAARGQIDPNRVGSRVEIIDYNPTGPVPAWLMPNSGWMQQYEAAMQRADLEMGDRAGQAEVSQGRAPAGAPAAAILALQEADESKLAISAKELADSARRVGWQVLMLVKQFWTEERVVRTWSEDGQLQAQRFSQDDLGDQFDVYVSSESMLPKSKAARAQLALDLWDRQILHDPGQFLRMLEVPGIGALQEVFDRGRRMAQREYEDLMTGTEVPVEDWHPHQVHIAQHNDDRMGEEYYHMEVAARAGDQQAAAVVALIERHVGEHMAWLQYQSTGMLPPGLAGGMHPGAMGGGGEEGAGPAPGGDEGGGKGGNGPSYLNPATGMPPNPLAVAAGQSPSALTMNPPNSLGGAGRVQGVTKDEQAHRQGM